MTIDQAKHISIKNYLASLGHFPVSQTTKSWIYFSPLRDEKTPSFHVLKNDQYFKDFGLDKDIKPGDIINLVKMLFNINFKQAMEKLNSTQINPADFYSYEKTLPPIKQRSKFQTKPINDISLINYIEKRGIPKSIWSKQENLVQAEYLVNNDKFINTAWKNDSNGYELRLTNFKSAEATKDITTIPGGIDLNIFEGFFDYLSALTFFKKPKLKNTTIVLNGISLISRATKLFNPNIKINLFLDNDKSSIAVTNRLLIEFPNCINQSTTYYPNHKDFNEFLTSL